MIARGRRERAGRVEDAKQRYEVVGDRAGIGQALGGIGAVLYDTNKLDEALPIFEAERKIAHETGTCRVKPRT